MVYMLRDIVSEGTCADGIHAERDIVSESIYADS